MHPETADVFFELGIHCIGCALAQFESLEEGLSAHGLTEDEIDDVVDKINKIISEKDQACS